MQGCLVPAASRSLLTLYILVLTFVSRASSENDVARDLKSSDAADTACSPIGTSLLQAASLKRNVGKAEPSTSYAVPSEDQQSQGQHEQSDKEEVGNSTAEQGDERWAIDKQLDGKGSQTALNVSAVLPLGLQRQQVEEDRIDLLTEAVPLSEANAGLTSDLSSNISKDEQPTGLQLWKTSGHDYSDTVEETLATYQQTQLQTYPQLRDQGGADSTSGLDSTSGFSATAQALGRKVKHFSTSFAHEMVWFAEEVSENGLSRRSSGVLLLIVFIVLAIILFCLTGPRRGNSSELRLASPNLNTGLPYGVLRTPDSPHRTPDVVPDECECVLAVPAYSPGGNYSICDMHGRPVLHATAQTSGRTDLRYENPRPLWRLFLKTPRGESFAQCIEMMPSTAGTLNVTGLEFHILDAKAEYFASLVQLQLPHGQQRFQLTTQAGDRLYIWGNFQTQAVNVTDEQGILLAATDPCMVEFDKSHAYYRLRVPRVANAGLPLCALLCIGQVMRSQELPRPAGR